MKFTPSYYARLSDDIVYVGTNVVIVTAKKVPDECFDNSAAVARLLQNAAAAPRFAVNRKRRVMSVKPETGGHFEFDANAWKFAQYQAGRRVRPEIMPETPERGVVAVWMVAGRVVAAVKSIDYQSRSTPDWRRRFEPTHRAVVGHSAYYGNGTVMVLVGPVERYTGCEDHSERFRKLLDSVFDDETVKLDENVAPLELYRVEDGDGDAAFFNAQLFDFAAKRAAPWDSVYVCALNDPDRVLAVWQLGPLTKAMLAGVHLA